MSDDAASAGRAGAHTVATFFAPDPLVAGALVTLGEDAAHHMRVRRLDVGDALALRDGAGGSAGGRLVRLAKSHAVVELGEVSHVAPPPAVHLLTPVADRDRMLWLAEKAAELGVASWRPVLWRRSRSVGPRGEGTGFQAKVRARMIAALVQSEGAWLPELYPDAPLDRAIRALPEASRLVLDPDGAPLDEIAPGAPVCVAVGPEGGIEPRELDELEAAGFHRARLPGNILRFETAAIVGVALARASADRSVRRATTESHSA
ncbi:RsmE family RNA methyltransferase [Gemmatirosa kalamazoonensis]|uniref:RsmE family RNA methyltransferase n=1 Tax=Gemmatirosa kalamazoonensis TaxID=861299 RepID=UPI0011DD2CFA|nr:RsmE family RNA methyltransferase [Gemmatirosa kalamazoonensis]